MEEKEIIERLDELMEDEVNKEAIYSAVGTSNVLGYIEATNDVGKGMIAGGCILLLSAWVSKKLI